jgi:DNA-binding CsgD family transcriptional regulator
VAQGFADLGVWLLAGEVAASADEAGRRAGDARGAAAWARRADEWRARCDTLPAVGGVARSSAVPLTRREREVALLVAEGLSSREVAERLYVGTRTVESHLARAYAKLGIRSRSELADLLGAEA